MRWLFLLGLFLPAAAFALEPPPSNLEDAAQDAQGVVWAYGSRQHNVIDSFDGNQWTSHVPSFAGNAEAMPLGVVKMADGAVACVWRFADHSIGVTRQRGNDVTVLGTCADKITGNGMNVKPLADSQNRLWIVGNFPEIYRADAKGGVTLMRRMGQNEPASFAGGQGSLRAVEDGHGRVWAWTKFWSGGPEETLIFTGDKAEPCNPLGPYSGARISALAPADDRHLWISLDNLGLFKIDIDTFELQRIPDPEPGAFSLAHEIFTDGADTYIVAYQAYLQCTLWQLRGVQWTHLINHFDVASNDWKPRSWLPIKEGLIVGTYGNGGAWFIPKQGEPALYSWRNGFPFENFLGIARFADGTFFGIGHNSKLFHGVLPLPPHDLPSRITEIEHDREWLVAKTGHIWMIPWSASLALKEWDGFKWITHDVPPEIKQLGRLNEDDQGRIWSSLQGVNVLDPHSGKWQSFPDLSTAFATLNVTASQLYRGAPGPRISAPEGCVTRTPDSMAMDNLGVIWLTWQDDLYKCIPGVCVKVFDADEADPFRSGRRVSSVFVDAQGNAFLETAVSGGERMMLQPKAEPAPKTQIVLTQKAGDSFVAQFDAHSTGPVMFRWQLDDGDYALSKTNSLALEHLANGTHVLKVTAIDDQLRMDATPATANFKAWMDWDRIMPSFVSQLSDSDYNKRKDAVATLASQPTVALPLLRKARETANDDQRWWIDVAIQACESPAK